MEDKISKIRQDCWDKALDSLGYSYIYSKRIENIELWLKWSKVLGIMIPLLLGGIVSSYYANQTIMQWSLIILTPAAIIQLIVSSYLTIVGSDDKLMNYIEKSTEFSILNSQFEQLAKYPLENISEHNKQYEILLTKEREISKGNHKIKDTELRMGMRYGLRNYRRNCAGCQEVPNSMTPTKCPVCGNF